MERTPELVGSSYATFWLINNKKKEMNKREIATMTRRFEKMRRVSEWKSEKRRVAMASRISNLFHFLLLIQFILETKDEKRAMRETEFYVKAAIISLRELGVSKEKLSCLDRYVKQCQYGVAIYVICVYVGAKFDEEEALWYILIEACKALLRYHKVKLDIAASPYRSNGCLHVNQTVSELLHPHIRDVRGCEESIESLVTQLNNIRQRDAEIEKWKVHQDTSLLKDMQAKKLADKLVSKGMELSEEDHSTLIQSLTPHLEVRVVEKDEIVFKERTNGDSIFFVGVGSVALYSSSEHEFAYETMGTGDVSSPVLLWFHSSDFRLLTLLFVAVFITAIWRVASYWSSTAEPR